LSNLPEIILHLKCQPVLRPLSKGTAETLCDVRSDTDAFGQETVKDSTRQSKVSRKLARCHRKAGQDIDAKNFAGVERGLVDAAQISIHGSPVCCGGRASGPMPAAVIRCDEMEFCVPFRRFYG
jgi:hypothetical protein